MGQLHRHYPWKKNSSLKTSKKSRITKIHDHHYTDQSENKMLGLQDLNQELMEEILLRVPLKTRTKLKSVSKSWRTSISSLRLSMPLRPSSGLVVFLKKSVIQFIQLHDEAFVHTASLHSCFSHSCASLVDSCNGLLLYGTLDSVTWTYHVARSDFDHAVALPPAHSVKRSVCTSLLFDGACYDKFKIMCLFLDEVDCDAGTIQCTVFDSKKCKWREYEARIVNSRLVSRDGFVRGQCFRPSVYSGNRLYCIWSLCLLIYDDEEGFFKLIQLPEDSIMKKSVKKNKNDHWFQLLWESEGQLHFCAPAPDKQGFCIWAYVNDEDNDFMDHNLMWKFKKFVVLKDSLISGQSPKSIRPVAFNDDLQRLYVLVLPARVIASYSFETQNFEKVWSFGEPGDSSMPNIFSFLLGSTSQM